MAQADRSNRDNFGLLPVEKRGFKSVGISALINVVIAAVVLLVSMSAVHVIQQKNLAATEIVFNPPTPKPVPPPRPHIHIYAPPPKTMASKIFTPPPRPVKAPPKPLHIRMPTPKLPNVPAASPRKVAPPPKPKVGLFKSVNPTPQANNKTHPSVHTGGFGDPLGAHVNPSQKRRTTLVAFGSNEDAPGKNSGAGRARPGAVHGVAFGSGVAHGARGGHSRGAVASAGFSNGVVGGSGPRGSHHAVASVAFGDNYGKSGPQRTQPKKTDTTPIVLTYKPLPTYTAQARQHHVQGDVTLRVRFTAAGQVRVLDVVHGLGYGLDRQAKIAARQIRFKPATQDGHPIDAVRIIRIAFQMT